ncbi:MAG: FkbM family methyltransferase [Actinomycetota bacterium]
MSTAEGLVASVLVPVHNATDTLGDQLQALVDQQGAPPFEVVVALNRCTDASGDVAESFADRLRVIVIEADERASAAHARNAAARAARGRHLLFCDADDRAAPRWVAEMVAPLEAGRADVVGGRIIVDRAGLPRSIHHARYRRFDGQCLHRAMSGLYYCLSASVACTRAAFEAVGGFDETFPGAGAEEVDLTSRMQRAGYRIGEAPDAELLYRPRTDLRGARAQLRSYAKGNMLLAAKEARLLPRPPAWLVAKRIIIRLGSQVLKQREWRPRALLLAADDTYAQHREIRRLWDAGYRARERDHDFPAPIGTPVVSGLAFSVSAATHEWYTYEGVEQHTIGVMAGLLQGGMFIDVGANIGVFSVAAALCGAPVMAFEPGDAARALLANNLRRHHCSALVEVRPEAVAEASGSAEFWSHGKDVVNGFTPAPAQFGPGPTLQRTMVPVVSLDDAVGDAAGPVDVTRIDVIKIDVEGHEAKVLDGAALLLQRNPDVSLIVELNPTALRAAGSNTAELMQRLPRDRWDIHLIDECSTPHLRAFDAEVQAWVAAAGAGWFGNLLAVPRGRPVPA